MSAAAPEEAESMMPVLVVGAHLSEEPAPRGGRGDERDPHVPHPLPPAPVPRPKRNRPRPPLLWGLELDDAKLPCFHEAELVLEQEGRRPARERRGRRRPRFQGDSNRGR